MKTFFEQCRARLRALRLPRAVILVLCAIAAALQAILLALYNVNSGPLRNLNDIGGWRNRLIFIVLCAAVHLLLLGLVSLQSLHSRVGFPRILLRQLLLTVGFTMLLGGINLKSYAYVQTLQPLIRSMDAGGLSAGLNADSGLSAPMVTLLYLLTRGPVYDMYMVKLAAIFGWLTLCLSGLALADRLTMGIRAEVALTLCLFLPQGYLSCAAAAQPEVLAVSLLAAGLLLLPSEKRSVRILGAVASGLACVLSGLCWYALPVAALKLRGRIDLRVLLLAPLTALAACLPEVFFGGLQTVPSLFSANLCLPAYASGAPGLLSLIPRAEITEMEGWFMLKRLAEVDFTTNAQLYYTQEHFVLLCRGFTAMGLGLYLLFLKTTAGTPGKKEAPLRGILLPALVCLLICPHTTASGWLAAGMLCALALVLEPPLRVPCCVLLFATAGAAAYPFTEETLLPVAATLALVFLALSMLLGIIPCTKEELRDD